MRKWLAGLVLAFFAGMAHAETVPTATVDAKPTTGCTVAGAAFTPIQIVRDTGEAWKCSSITGLWEPADLPACSGGVGSACETNSVCQTGTTVMLCPAGTKVALTAAATTAPGADSQIVRNESNALAATSDLTYDQATKTLTVGAGATAGKINLLTEGDAGNLVINCNATICSLCFEGAASLGAENAENCLIIPNPNPSTTDRNFTLPAASSGTGAVLEGPQTHTGAHTFTGTLNIPSGTSPPGSCTEPAIFFDTDATAASRFMCCSDAGTFVVCGGGGTTTAGPGGNPDDVQVNVGGVLAGVPGFTATSTGAVSTKMLNTEHHVADCNELISVLAAATGAVTVHVRDGDSTCSGPIVIPDNAHVYLGAGTLTLSGTDGAIQVLTDGGAKTDVWLIGKGMASPASTGSTVASQRGSQLLYPGTGAAIKLGDHTHSYGFTNSLSFARFEGFTLYHTGTPTTQKGFYGITVRRTVFQDVKIENFTRGIDLETVSDFNTFVRLFMRNQSEYGVYLNRECNGNTFTDVDIAQYTRDNGRSVWGMWLDWTSVNTIIQGSRFHNFDTTNFGAVQIRRSGPVTITGNYFEGNYFSLALRGGTDYGVDGAVIEGNIFTQIEGAAIDTNHSDATHRVRGVNISGNWFVNPSTSAPYDVSKAISLHIHTRDIFLTGNTYDNFDPIVAGVPRQVVTSAPGPNYTRIHDDAGTVLFGKRYANEYATAGAGTATSPWTGWESAVCDQCQTHFPAGFYATSTGVDLLLTLRNAPGRTSITGDGNESTTIVATADVTALRVRALNGVCSPSSTGGSAGLACTSTQPVGSVCLGALGFCLATGQLFMENIGFTTNVNNTQTAGLVSLEGLDTVWTLRNVAIRDRNALDTTTQTLHTGLRLMNSQNGVIENLYVRGTQSTTPGITRGVIITANDNAQRGNITFMSGQISRAMTGIKVDSKAEGGSSNLSGISFYGMKMVNGSGGTNQVGTKGFDIDHAGDTMLFSNVHVENFQTGIELDGANGVTILGGLISGANDNNASPGAGHAIRIGSDMLCIGVSIITPAFAGCYSGITIGNPPPGPPGSTATQRVTYIKGHITGSVPVLPGGEWNDYTTVPVTQASSHGNLRIEGAVFPDGLDVKTTTADGNGLRLWNTEPDIITTPAEASPRIILQPGGYQSGGRTTFIRANDVGNVEILNDTSGIGLSVSQAGVIRVPNLASTCTALETNASGDVICGTDDSGGITTGDKVDIIVNSAVDWQIDLDTVGAPELANDSVGTTEVNFSYVSTATTNQGLLVTGTEGASVGLQGCAAGKILKSVAGTPTTWACADDDSGGITAGDRTDINVVTPASDWQIKADAVGAPELANDSVGTTEINFSYVSGITASQGLTLSGSSEGATVGLQTCLPGKILKNVGGASWACADDSLDTAGATGGNALIFNGTSWAAGPLNLADPDAVGTSRLGFTNLVQATGAGVVGQDGGVLPDDYFLMTAANDGEVMRRSGSTVGFGAINLESPNIFGASIMPGAKVQLNGLLNYGVVPPGTGNANKVWATDTAGTPSWTTPTGGSLTIREVDGSPSFTTTTMEFENPSFIVIDQTAGVSRVTLDTDLFSLANASTTGLYTRTAAGVSATRSIAAGSGKLSVTQADGVAGNPTLDVVESALTHDNIGGTLGPTKGGTGQTTITQGDLLYGSAANTISKLPKNATATRYLSNTGTSNNPAWAQVNLTDGVTGSLPATALEGLGSTQGQILYRGASNWTALNPGTAGQVLQSGGPAANPSWASGGGTGDLIKSGTYAANQILTAVGTGNTVQATGVTIDLTTGAVDVPAPAANGGCTSLKEGQDDGTNTVSLCIPNSGITSSPTYTTNVDGVFPAAMMPNADDDGTTKGVASFADVDFDATTGNVTISGAVTRDTDWDTAADINGATTDDDFVTLAGTQSVTGVKTFTTPKILDSTGGQTYDVAVSNLAANRTITLPLLTTADTYVFEAHAQTLTNKTFAAANNVFTLENGGSVSATTAGQIKIDTTATPDQLVYFGETSAQVVDARQTLSVVLMSPLATDDPLILKAPYGMTITDIDCITTGTGTPTAPITLTECDSSNSTCTGTGLGALDTVAVSCVSGGAADDGSFDGAGGSAIASANWLKLDIGTPTGTVTQVSVTITYRVVQE